MAAIRNITSFYLAGTSAIVSLQIAGSGMDLKIMKSPGGTQTITVTRREGGTTVSETITTTTTSSASAPSAQPFASAAAGPKRPRIDSNYRKQFETQV